jgi:hypothetical protein
MRAWIQRWKQQRWEQKDRRRRKQLEQAAFADGRFVLYITVAGRHAPVCFMPRESEARAFFGLYVVPWMRGELRWFSHSTWDGLPGGPAATVGPYSEVYRGYDVRQVVFFAPTLEYRQRLDNVLAEMVREAEAAAEANKVAERSVAYTLMVAATRDAHRAIEDDRR